MLLSLEMDLAPTSFPQWQTDTDWIPAFYRARYVSWKLSRRLVGPDGEWKGFGLHVLQALFPFLSLFLCLSLILCTYWLSKLPLIFFYLFNPSLPPPPHPHTQHPLWLLEILQLCAGLWCVTKGEGLYLVVFRRGLCSWHTIPSACCHVSSTLPISDVTWQVCVCVCVRFCLCVVSCILQLCGGEWGWGGAGWRGRRRTNNRI